MRRHVRVAARPQRTTRVGRKVPRRVAPVVRKAVRAELPVLRRAPAPAGISVPAWNGFQIDPYVDYGRFLTSEGGILLVYKDLDPRIRHMLWRAFAWAVSTGGEAWYLLHHSPVQALWINVACLIAVGAVNLFIVSKGVEMYRSIEIRPDCMIIEDADIFWLRHMENGWPTLQADDKGNQRLCGIYGTRFVEYLTIRRFEELDRMPEVFAAHLQEAMKQLWGRNGQFQ
jgi:hypothetical protein